MSALNNLNVSETAVARNEMSKDQPLKLRSCCHEVLDLLNIYLNS